MKAINTRTANVTIFVSGTSDIFNVTATQVCISNGTKIDDVDSTVK